MVSGVSVFQVQKHCQNSQSKVRYRFSDLNDTDLFVAEFHESIQRYIPEIVFLLSDVQWSVRIAGAYALSKLSEQGKV